MIKRYGFPLNPQAATTGQYISELTSGFVRKLTKTTGNNYNIHRSNRAKEGNEQQ